MATFYLKSGSGVTQFAQSTAYSLGDRIVPVRSDAGSNYLTARKWVWECTTAGTTAAANPTWPASVTNDVTTITSGTAVFTARKPGFSSGTTAAWSFATIFLDYAITAPTAVGDILYVSNNHAESVNAAISAAASVAGVSVICVDDSAAPPTATATTATVTTTGNSAITIGGIAREYYYGINFISGSGASGTASCSTNSIDAENCTFQIASTGASSIISSQGIFKNCGYKVAAAAQSIVVGSNGFKLFGCSLLSGGTSPTAMFSSPNADSCEVDGFDLSNASAGVNIAGNSVSGAKIFLSNIKLPASWSGSVASGTPTAPNGHVTMMNGGNTGTNYVLNSKTGKGATTQETTVVKTGGFSVAGTPISWKLVGTSGCGPAGCYINSHFTPEIAAYNSTTGSAVTVTVDVVHDSVTNLQNNEIYLEVTYLGASGSPLGTYTSSRPATPMTAASDLAASTATWTTTGLAAPNAQKLTVTFTPQLAGMIIGRVKLCKASKTVYVDPVLQLS